MKDYQDSAFSTFGCLDDSTYIQGRYRCNIYKREFRHRSRQALRATMHNSRPQCSGNIEQGQDDLILSLMHRCLRQADLKVIMNLSSEASWAGGRS